MKAYRPILGTALAALTLSSCQFFYDVTVPATDPYDPYAYVSMWLDGEWLHTTGGQKSFVDAQGDIEFQHLTTNRFKTYVALSATNDWGGAAEVEMRHRLVLRCLSAGPSFQVLENWDGNIATQTGSVGEVVRSGVWTSRAFRPIDYIPTITECDRYYLDLDWYTRAEDLAGNSTYFGRGRVRYHHLGS